MINDCIFGYTSKSDQLITLAKYLFPAFMFTQNIYYVEKIPSAYLTVLILFSLTYTQDSLNFLLDFVITMSTELTEKRIDSFRVHYLILS